MRFVHLYAGVSASSSEGRQSSSLQFQMMQTAMPMSYVGNVFNTAEEPTLIFEPALVIAVIGAVKGRRFALRSGSIREESGGVARRSVWNDWEHDSV